MTNVRGDEFDTSLRWPRYYALRNVIGWCLDPACWTWGLFTWAAGIIGSVACANIAVPKSNPTSHPVSESKRFVIGDWTPGLETLMSKKTGWVSTAALAVVLVVIGLLVGSRTTAAQEGNVAECTGFVNSSITQAWMREQIRQNRNTFVSVPSGLCAYYHR